MTARCGTVQAKHVGKVVTHTAAATHSAEEQGQWVIADGLRPLGIATANWLAKRHGRHHLVLLDTVGRCVLAASSMSSTTTHAEDSLTACMQEIPGWQHFHISHPKKSGSESANMRRHRCSVSTSLQPRMCAYRRLSGPPEGVLADAMHGTFAGSVTVALSSTTVADTRAALLPVTGHPALQGFIAAGRVDDVAGGRAVHGPSVVDAGHYAQAARQLPCATMLSFASAGELAVSGLRRHVAHSCPAVLHIARSKAAGHMCMQARRFQSCLMAKASRVSTMSTLCRLHHGCDAGWLG